VGGSVEGVVFINADTNMNVTSSFTKSLYSKPIFSYENSINIPVCSYGPIVLNINAGIGMSVPLTISITTPIQYNGRLAFTG
jgi:hypothetical protein